jgi:hypothetical protein
MDRTAGSGVIGNQQSVIGILTSGGWLVGTGTIVRLALGVFRSPGLRREQEGSTGIHFI